MKSESYIQVTLSTLCAYELNFIKFRFRRIINIFASIFWFLCSEGVATPNVSLKKKSITIPL